jgi:hypothetical protein
MNRFVENALSAATALLIGFYIGTQWNGKEPANAPEELLAESQLAHPAAHVAAPAAVTSPAGIGDVSQSVAAQPSPAAQAPQPACPNPEPASQQIAHTETAPGFDSKKLDAFYQQIKSEDPQQRQQALLALAKLGTEDVVSDLIRAAADDEESGELRRELIQQIDWSGHTEELAGIISKSRDAEARLAAVNAISAAKNLTEEEFVKLGEVIMNNFLIEPEEGIKIATLNCIQAVYPDSFQEILERYPRVLATPEVRNYLKMIETPPDEMEQAPVEEKSEELGE